jgi:hypothetical protein
MPASGTTGFSFVMAALLDNGYLYEIAAVAGDCAVCLANERYKWREITIPPLQPSFPNPPQEPGRTIQAIVRD